MFDNSLRVAASLGLLAMREPIRLLLRPAPLLALLLCTAGCPHRTPPAADSAGDADLRRKNLFAAFDAEARDLSLVNAYLLELACYVGDKGTRAVPVVTMSRAGTRLSSSVPTSGVATTASRLAPGVPRRARGRRSD